MMGCGVNGVFEVYTLRLYFMGWVGGVCYVSCVYMCLYQYVYIYIFIMYT